MLWGTAVGLATGAIAWMYGVQGIRPGLVALAAVVVAVAFRGFENAVYRTWPQRPRMVVGGGTSVVSRLAQRVRRHTDRKRGPDPGVAHQIRRLVNVRLARRGLSLSHPGADTILGAGVRQAILSDDSPDPATVTLALAAVERLDRADRHQGAAT